MATAMARPISQSASTRARRGSRCRSRSSGFLVIAESLAFRDKTNLKTRRQCRLVEGDPPRRPVGHENFADQVRSRNRAPLARVARRAAIVAHEEVLALGHAPLAVVVTAPCRLDVVCLLYTSPSPRDR